MEDQDLRDYFREFREILHEQSVTLTDIRIQTTKTNGRVTNLENRMSNVENCSKGRFDDSEKVLGLPKIYYLWLLLGGGSGVGAAELLSKLSN